MNIKKFLKPDRKKIITFLVICYIFAYLLPAPLQLILSHPGILILVGLIDIIDFIWEDFLTSDYALILVVVEVGVSLFCFYLISCFIILICDKAEKKFSQNRF